MADSKPISNEDSLVENIHIILSCPICLTLAHEDFILCTTGHLICGYCAIKIQQCPICQSKLVMKSPICLKNLLDILPRKCMYDVYGCKELLPFAGMSEHEKFCGYRLVHCHLVYERTFCCSSSRTRANVESPIMSCGKKVSLCELVNHYEKKHPEVPFFKSNCNYVVLSGPFALKSDYELLIIPIFTPENVIWLICHNVNNYLRIKSVLSPIGQQKINPFVRITFKNSDFVDTRSLRPNINTGSLNLKDTEVDLHDDMVVPESSMKRFRNNDGSLKFAVEVFFDKKLEQDE